MFVILTSVDLTFLIRYNRDSTGIFLNQLTTFYSNNATNLHHLTTHSTTRWPTKWRSYCDHRYVTSLHPIYTLASLSKNMPRTHQRPRNLISHQRWTEER